MFTAAAIRARKARVIIGATVLFALIIFFAILVNR